jgi:histone H3/H4
MARHKKSPRQETTTVAAATVKQGAPCMQVEREDTDEAIVTKSDEHNVAPVFKDLDNSYGHNIAPISEELGTNTKDTPTEDDNDTTSADENEGKDTHAADPNDDDDTDAENGKDTSIEDGSSDKDDEAPDNPSSAIADNDLPDGADARPETCTPDPRGGTLVETGPVTQTETGLVQRRSNRARTSPRGRKGKRSVAKAQRKAVHDMRTDQAHVGVFIPRAAMERIVRQIGNEFKGELRFQAGAFEALHEAAVSYMTEVFSRTNDMPRSRATLTVNYVQAAVAQISHTRQ